MPRLYARLEHALPGVVWLCAASLLGAALYAFRFYLGVPRDAYASLALHSYEELPLLLYVTSAMAVLALGNSLTSLLALAFRRALGGWPAALGFGLLHFGLLLPSLSGQSRFLQDARPVLLPVALVVCIGVSFLALRLVRKAEAFVPVSSSGRGFIARLRQPRLWRWGHLGIAAAAYLALHLATKPLALYPGLLVFLSSVSTFALACALVEVPLPASVLKFKRVALGLFGATVLLALLSLSFCSHAQSFARVRYIFSRRCVGADALVRLPQSARAEWLKVSAALLPGVTSQGRTIPTGFTPGSLRATPHVVFFVIDAMRWDIALGTPNGPAPNLRKLAEFGRNYEHAYSASSGTAQSMTACFSGLPPGVLAKLEVVPPFLPDAFQQMGYQTSTVWGLGILRIDATFAMLKDKSHRAMGFRDEFNPKGSTHREHDEYQVEAALERLETAATPRFEYLHLLEAHGPFEGDDSKKRYEEALLNADANLGRFWQGLVQAHLSDDTLLLVLGDHGEGLGEHGRVGHNQTLYSNETRVPLVIVGPGFAPSRQSQPTSLMQLPQIVLEALGSSWPFGDQGGLAGPHGKAGYVLQEYKMLDEVTQRTLRSQTEAFHHLYIDGRRELYASQNDPDERTPLPLDDETKERYDRLEQAIDQWQANWVERIEALPRYP